MIRPKWNYIFYMNGFKSASGTGFGIYGMNIPTYKTVVT